MAHDSVQKTHLQYITCLDVAKNAFITNNSIHLVDGTTLSTIFITSFIALTVWFWLWLFVVLLWLPPELRRGVIHEALDHMGPDQSEPTECPMLHHKYCQRRVEVGLLRQLLIGSNTGRGKKKTGRRLLAMSVLHMHAMDTPGLPKSVKEGCISLSQ